MAVDNRIFIDGPGVSIYIVKSKLPESWGDSAERIIADICAETNSDADDFTVNDLSNVRAVE